MTRRRADPPVNLNRRANGRYDWERAVISSDGPRSPTTRLVLLALATFVGRGVAHAWPSLSKLEACTALSRRSVIDHLEAAVAGGWLQRQFTRLEGRNYRGNVYWLTLPLIAERGGERPSPVHAGRRPTGEASAASGEPRSATGERRDGELVNVVPRTNLLNRERNRLGDQTAGINPGTRTAKQGPDGVEEWAAELGLAKCVGERNADFQVRVMEAVQRHKRQSAA